MQSYDDKFLVLTSQAVHLFSVEQGSEGDEIWVRAFGARLISANMASEGVLLSAEFTEDAPKFEYAHESEPAQFLIWLNMDGETMAYRNMGYKKIMSIYNSEGTLLFGIGESIMGLSSFLIFGLKKCHETCSDCFGTEKDECFSCNTYQLDSY